MKKSIILLVALLVGFTLQAQIKNPDATTIGKSKRLEGVIQPLSETQTYNLVLPTKLTYWTKGKKDPGGFHNSLTVRAYHMKAKYNNKTPDYVFTLVTNGMQQVEQLGIVPFAGGARAVLYRYTFPVKLQLSDKQGTVLKTFILSGDDDWLTGTVTANFLVDVNPETNTPAGFTTSEENIEKWITDHETDVLVRMEYNMLVSITELASEVITAAYGYPAMQWRPVIFALAKKDKPNNPELDQAITQLNTNVAQVFGGPVNNELQQALLASGNFFESKYDASSSKEMTRLCALNAGLAYLLGGDSEKAYGHFVNANKVLGFMSSASGSVLFFADVSLMNQLREKKDSNEIAVTPTYSVEQRKKMEEEAVVRAKALAAQQQQNADRAVLEARNVKGQEGYVITAEGEKIEGVISLKFVETSNSNIVDMDLGKVVWLTANDTKKAYHPKDVTCVVVGETRYEPVAVAIGAGWQVLGVITTGSNIAGACFLKLVHRVGNCAAYIDPSSAFSDTYLIQKEQGGKASYFSDLLKNKKATKTFIGNCPALQEKLDAKALADDEAGAKLFVDLLHGCLQ